MASVLATSILDAQVYKFLVIALAWAYFTRWAFLYVQTRLQVRGLPQIHSAIEFFESGFRNKLPHIPFLLPARDYTIDDPWKNARSDLLAMTQLSTPEYAVYTTASAKVANLAMLSAKSKVFLKPTDMFRYNAINIFGMQIVSVQTGPEHKRHKDAVKGCFGEETMQNGFFKMQDSFDVMVKEMEFEKGGIMEDVRRTMIKVTLLTVGKSWFGISIPWNIPHTDGSLRMASLGLMTQWLGSKADNMTVPFFEALEIVELELIAQLLLPLWFMEYNPIPHLRRLGKGQRSLVHHIKSMMSARRAEIEAERASLAAGVRPKPQKDVLGALVASQMDSEAELGGTGLTEEETIANIFIFIIAGHETTAHTLSFVLALLALNPKWQDEIYKEVTQVCGDCPPTYKDVNALPLTLAACYETIRLRDLVMTLPRVTSEDTVIPYTTWDAAGNVTQHQRPIPKGSHVIIDSPACGHNPFSWEDAEAFNPRRFLGEKGKKLREDEFTGFALGVRSCIGKRFAEVEMVCFLANFVRLFRWSPVAKAGETRELVAERILKGTEIINLTPGKFDIKVDRR